MPRAKSPAPPAPTSPEPAAVSRTLATTPTYESEVRALHDLTMRVVDLNDIEMRIGLMARIVLETALRSHGQMSLKDKAELALKSITVLEGSKQEVVWRDTLTARPVRKDTEALAAERAQVEKRLMAILTRKKEVQLASAEEALKHMPARSDATKDSAPSGTAPADGSTN